MPYEIGAKSANLSTATALGAVRRAERLGASHDPAQAEPRRIRCVAPDADWAASVGDLLIARVVPTDAEIGVPGNLVTVRFYVLSSRWEDEPIRLFQTQGEAEDALRRVGEDTLGLAADAFVTEAEFDFKAADRGPGEGRGG
jgi:hypothetical protein